jgi:glycosyltransferase involved in cell wall biosynthesis
MAKEVVRLVGIRPKVIPFGVDVAQFSPLPKSPSNRVLIGTARRFLPRYGLDVLIKAFGSLVAEEGFGVEPSSLDLMLVGDGPQKPELLRLAKAMGVDARISFPGYIRHQELPSVMRQMDIFVVPSRSESFGVAALEASACGLPVVASKVGGLPEVVQHEVTGLLFASEDVQALAGALAKLAAAPDLRHKMGQAGRQWVVQQYSWGQSVDQMESLYRQFLTSRA